MNTQFPKNLSVAQVYVIQNELGLAKIGFANKPNNRFDSIAANSGLKIIRHHVSPPCFNFADIEKQLHQQFSHARKYGEWFDLPFEIAVEALNAHFVTPIPSDNQALVSFNFQDHPLRTLQKNGETWFCLKDACDILEINNSRDVANRLTDSGVVSNDITTSEGIRKITFVNEPNLYRVIFRSDKPQAKAFQDWVFEKVLPSIRKTGGYGQTNLTPELQTFLRATIANEVNAALQSKTNTSQILSTDKLSISERKIIDAISDGYITPSKIANHSGVNYRTAKCYLRKMLKKGLIKQIDYGKYQLINSNDGEK